MTDNRQPEALWLADELDAEFAQGRISNHTGRKAATELRRQHARIAELEAQLESIAASAGSEPVAWLVCTEEGDPDMVFLSQHEAQQYLEDDERPTPLYTHPSPPEGMVGGWMPIDTAPKYTEHGVKQHILLGYAPDEIHEDGFVSQGYWMEAEEDAPDNMGHDGGWVDVHFDFFRCGRSFGAEAYRSAGTQPTHWMPLPPSPTTSAGSGKGGES